MRCLAGHVLVGLLALGVTHGDTPQETLAAAVQQVLDDGQPGKAVEMIVETTPESERTADLWFLMARGYNTMLDEASLLRKRGLAGKLRQALESALGLEPGHVDARRELADFYHYAPWIVGGSETKAEEQLDRLETVAPGAAFSTRAKHAQSSGDLEQARAHYRTSLRHTPDDRDVSMALARVEQDLGAFVESVRLLDQLIEADPESAAAYYYLARATALGQIDLERGLESVTKFLELCDDCSSSSRGFAWWRRATLLEHVSEPEKAIVAYHKALRLNPELEDVRKRIKELE